MAAQGVDVNSKDESDMTPLFFAAVNGHASCVELLLKSGAGTTSHRTWPQTYFFFLSILAFHILKYLSLIVNLYKFKSLLPSVDRSDKFCRCERAR
jgi:ankyrin repeat protein